MRNARRSCGNNGCADRRGRENGKQDAGHGAQHGQRGGAEHHALIAFEHAHGGERGEDDQRRGEQRADQIHGQHDDDGGYDRDQQVVHAGRRAPWRKRTIRQR